MKTISTADAPAAIGFLPCRPLRRNPVLLRTAWHRSCHGQLPEGVAAQTEQSLKNIRALLTAAGAASKTVKTTVFITNMADFPFGQHDTPKVFAENPPARPCVAVKELPSAGWLKRSARRRPTPGMPQAPPNVRQWNTVSAACGPAYVSSDLGLARRNKYPPLRTGSLPVPLGGIARYVPRAQQRLHHALTL